MLSVVLIAGVLVAVTVGVHCTGLAWLVRLLMNAHYPLPTRLWPVTLLLVRIALCLITISLVEIAIWGAFYLWKGLLPDAESAFYFSGITYTSIGYGDLVLLKPWRILGPVEGLIGILMSGLSAGLFFAVLSRIYRSRFETGGK
jgi:hypothetical protein